jgi:ketosteroid isomerase-like protein
MTPAEQLMKNVIESWGQADVSPAFDAFDENIVWKSASTCENGAFRFGGIYRGKANVIALLSKISTEYFFQQYTTKEIISKGEIVWGLFDVHGSYLQRGQGQVRKAIALESAFRWRVRDGKILEAQSFFDTAALLVQQGELRVDAA